MGIEMEYSYPWNHFLFDNFLSEDRLKALQSLLGQHKSDFRMEDDDELQINYKFLPDIELAKYFLSSNFKSFLETTTGLSLTLNPKSLVQLRLMTSESPAFPCHVDNQDEKSLVCIMYVSPDWRPEFGGELILHLDKESNPTGPDSKVISPIGNRMILFRSEDTHWHSVNSVKNWLRYSIIMEWIIK
jgi:Rps23 Pro-64 3,4-dihydroxylase Tpa1-like proline 4-hydroxylase